MKWIINYIRSCFCEHEWELVDDITIRSGEHGGTPIGYKKIYRCKKCGYAKILKY